jgi:hypothetical protein
MRNAYNILNGKPELKRPLVRLIHWNRVLLEKLRFCQLLKKFSFFYGT